MVELIEEVKLSFCPISRSTACATTDIIVGVGGEGGGYGVGYAIKPLDVSF